MTLGFGLTLASPLPSPKLEQPAAEERSSILLILDASGSMNRKDPSSEPASRLPRGVE